jgi:hypothetical protein
VNITNSDGETPLFVAVHEQQKNHCQKNHCQKNHYWHEKQKVLKGDEL